MLPQEGEERIEDHLTAHGMRVHRAIQLLKTRLGSVSEACAAPLKAIRSDSDGPSITLCYI